MILPAVWFDDVAHDHRDRPESPDHIRGMTRAQALLLDAVCSTTARTDEAATVMVERLWPV
jgi:hypothetical protein